jgi:alkylhydroperoxidase/carboxymuconolactone decarboxylase family protein YurZ
MTGSGEHDWTFSWEAPVHDVFPALHDAQAAWLSAIDSLGAPDRRTHELVRMVCQVAARSPVGIERHAMLAAEIGVPWEDIVGSIMLTMPTFGVLAAAEALPAARRGYDKGLAARSADDERGD